MEEHDELTSLVRSNNALNGAHSPSHINNNGYNTSNGRHHNHVGTDNNTRAHPPREDFARRDPRTFFVEVQRSLALFQSWATKALHENQEAPFVNWVQNTRVARTFMMVMNVVLAIFAFLLMGIEMVEMALREPILDYLLPESELVLLVAGLTIVTGAFGFAVAYNLLVEQDITNIRNNENNDEGSRGNGSGGNGRDLGPRTPTQPRSTDNILGQSNDTPLVLQPQQTRRPRLMFTKASTYLLNGNTIFLIVVLVAFTISVAQRSAHLSQMEKELNDAWTDAYRHRKALISNFELRHQCCGFDHISQRPFPTDCSTNSSYGFKVPCKAELTKDFERWQNRIQYLFLTLVVMLVPLLLLVMTLSAVGFSKLKERTREGSEDTEAQADAAASGPAVDGRRGAQLERPLLEDVTPHIGAMPFLVDVEAEPVRRTHDRPLVQPSLI